MQRLSLQKLEWGLLLERIGKYSQTEEGQRRIAELIPQMDDEQVKKHWQNTQPLADLCKQGYRAPIGEVEPISAQIKAAQLGQVLTGEDLCRVLKLLLASQKVSQFARDFRNRASYLDRVAQMVYSLPKLRQAIEKAIDAEGELKDDASPELTRIRKQKKLLRVKIESSLKKLLRDHDLEKYIQDDYYTIRAERYVIPISLDGRGRIKGSILDTSSSGQTLFIEPSSISALNDDLRELELAEKLEIIRIFKELTRFVAEETDTLIENYAQIIELDFMSSQAQFAAEINANTVQISDSPSLNLINARHPLLGKEVVSNSVALAKDQRALIISGPNAGGKTVVLKTVGLLHAMLKAGLLLPCDNESWFFIYSDIHIELGDSQNLSANLSTFSGHIQALSPIIKYSRSSDLVLLDELAVGTEPQTGAALAQAILERLVENGSTVVTTTHYDGLKIMAVHDRRFRNGSMEYSLDTFTPTYKLVLDVPGQSYGLEVARQHGFDHRIIERASLLRGESISILDAAIGDLTKARQSCQVAEQKALEEEQEAISVKARWQHELEVFNHSKRKSLADLRENYEQKLREYKSEFHRLTDELKKEMKSIRENAVEWDKKEKTGKQKEKIKSHLDSFQNEIYKMNNGTQKSEKIPGQPVERSKVKVGERVFAVSLGKDGVISQIHDARLGLVEVQLGALKVKLNCDDLRLISSAKPTTPASIKNLGRKRGKGKPQNEIVFQSSTNSLDLRGSMVDDAIERMWKFIDSAMLRGEYAVIIIHGHGTDSLKNAVREALKDDQQYSIRYEAGQRANGGDGVTIVRFDAV